MTLTEIITAMRDAFGTVGFVHSVYEGDPYDDWNNNEVRYLSACVALENITTSDNTKEYSFIIYAADRLLEDNSNANQCWDNSEVAISSALNYMANYGDSDILNIAADKTFTPFSQKFADNLAGVYVRAQITVRNPLSLCTE